MNPTRTDTALTDTALTDTALTDTAPTDTALTATPGQTVGPFFGYALPFDRGNELVAPGSPGSIRLHGVLTDGAGDPVPDALVEIWQADPEGSIVTVGGSLRRDGATFTGWGRAATDGEGHYGFTTLPPGPTRPGAAPFIMVTVFARGLLDRLFTRAYLPGEHLDTDPLLTALPPDRRHTLITVPDHSGLRFDISLQGPGETVFLHYPGHQP
jgi:protocatechuate 3,4-dioxygenase alpha subunit